MEGPRAESGIEDRIQNLPLIDATVAEILTLLNSAESNFEQIVRRLSPEVAAKFLNMANSAYYGVDVKSIDYAVRVLGYSGMKQVLLLSELVDHFSKQRADDPFEFERYLREAQFCSCLSRVLGRALGYRDPAELFTASMLHNIGEMVIAFHFRDEHRRIAERLASEPFSAVEVEREVLGLHHAEIGAVTLKTFFLPENLLDAVRYHHAEDRVPPEDANFAMELIVRASAGLLEKGGPADGLDMSGMEGVLQACLDAECERPREDGTGRGDIYEGVEACSKEIDRAAGALAEALAGSARSNGKREATRAP